MRLVFISDTHDLQQDMRHPIPEGDVLIHTGDATWKGRQGEVKRFSKWMKTQPHSYKLFVPGNHDITFETKRQYAEGMWLDPSVMVLINKSVTIEGVKFFGCPVVKPWDGYEWAFGVESISRRKHIYGSIPEDVDVLLTHQPSYMMLDLNLSNQHEGDVQLRHCVERVKPKVHAHGHIHEAYGVQAMYHGDGSKTTCINAAICDRDYVPVNKPIVLDI